MKTFFLIIVILPLQIFSQNYLWPTNSSQYMSSSFGEYRPGHYHAAIDVKTWNREGYPCYAIADGTIYRIRVSPHGYGKVIYLKLDDGNYAIYAHLKGFTPEIDKIIREQQIKNERYRFNWRPKHWAVKKGDIIGYTGQTGIGVPHLHFELRDPEHQPFNPLYFYKDVIKDNRAPVLKSLLILPQYADSRVEGSFNSRVYPLHYMGDDIYHIDGPVRATGTIGLALNGYDMADDVYNKFAFYETQLYVDDGKTFHISYDTLNYDVTGQIHVEIVYPYWINERTVYHKLYIDPYNELPFYDHSLGSGLISVGDTSRTFTVVVSDFHGNTRKIKGEIIPEKTPVKRSHYAAAKNSNLTDSLRPQPQLDIHNTGKFLRLDFNNVPDVDSLLLSVAGDTITPFVMNSRFEYVLPASRVDSGDVSIRLERTGFVLLDSTFTIFRLVPGKAQTWQLDGGRITLNSDKNSLYDTLLVRMQIEENLEEPFPAPVLSTLYNWFPHDQKLKDDVNISIQYDSSDVNTRQLGIYSTNGNGRLRYLGSIRDSLRQTVAVNTERLNTMIIAADTTAPAIDIIYPAANRAYTVVKQIHLRAFDDLSGIEDENTLRVTLDGRFVLPEWDPEKNGIVCRPHFDVEPGEHRLVVRVGDAAGNTTEEVLTFRIE